MKPTTRRRLELRRDTVRVLRDDVLYAIQGGAKPNSDTQCNLQGQDANPDVCGVSNKVCVSA
jgi:hypothetical protein